MDVNSPSASSNAPDTVAYLRQRARLPRQHRISRHKLRRRMRSVIWISLQALGIALVLYMWYLLVTGEKRAFLVRPPDACMMSRAMPDGFAGGTRSVPVP